MNLQMNYANSTLQYKSFEMVSTTTTNAKD